MWLLFQDHGIASGPMIYLCEFFSERKSSVYERHHDVYTKVFAAECEVWFNMETELIGGYR